MLPAALTSLERHLLSTAVIGIAGAGGLGSNVAAHLVRSGIGKVVIADFDVVTAPNLDRQFFFADQVGLKKVDALAENLRRISDKTVVETYDCRLDPENIRHHFADCSIIVEAFDDAEAKTMLIRTALMMRKKVVAVSGIAGWGGSNGIRVKKIGDGLYLVGDQGEMSEEVRPRSPRVGIAAAMQANTVIAILLGLDP